MTEIADSSPLAPNVPWSPVRQSFDLNESVSSLLTVPDETHLNSPHLNSPLIIPEVVVDSSEKKMEDAEKECHKNVRLCKRSLRLTDPDGRDPGLVAKHHDSWYQKLEDEVNNVIDAVEDLCTEFGQTLGPTSVAAWKDTITTCENEFKERGDAWWTLVRPLPVSGSVPLVPLPHPVQGGAQSHRAQEALADITVDYEIIVAEGARVKEEYQKHLSWNLASDNDIELAMNKIEDWKRRFERLQDKRWSIQRKTMSFQLDDRKMNAATFFMNTLGSELDIAVEEIRYEDETRCLFSINKTKTASVKLPTFGGEAGEDFSKFEKEMKKGLITNRVKRADQVAKLREHLKARPKGMIPSNMEDIDEAWRILREIYGDATRVMKARRANIQAMRQMPSRSNTSGEKVEEHIEWLLKLELALQDMFEIGKQSVDMDRMAFGPDLVDTIHRLFPYDIQEKFADFDATDSKTKLSLMYDFISELRRKKQILLKAAANSETAGITIDDDTSSSNKSEGDSDDLSVDVQSEFAGCTVESNTSGSDDEGSSDGVSDEEHPFEPGGERGHSA